MAKGFQSVASSHIQSAAYDEDTKILSIQFKGGRVYHYHDVPPDEYEAFVNAPSAGSHFHDNIKDIYTTKKA